MTGKSSWWSVDQAVEQLMAHASPISELEIVPLAAVLGRVLAEDIIAAEDVPPADNSAMDGYAVDAATLPAEGTWLRVSQRVTAGDVPATLEPGTAARIFTGASIPAGANAVVIQERARLEEARPGFVWVPSALMHDNVRPRGQDVAAGTAIVAGGTRMDAVHAGLLASMGVSAVQVRRRLRVSVLSTGNELVEPGQPRRPGQIYNSNRPLLAGLLSGLGCEVIDVGIVPDDPRLTEQALREAAQADCIVSSGGVSVGEEDHVRHVIERLGSVTFASVAIKPGKPFAFGQVLGTPYLALPGNPASVFVTFLVLCRPWLMARQGRRYSPPLRLWLPAQFSHPVPGKRDEYLRARIEVHGEVVIHPRQSSGMLSSACWANALAVVPAGQTVTPGQPVEVWPLADLLV